MDGGDVAMLWEVFDAIKQRIERFGGKARVRPLGYITEEEL